VFVFEDIFPFFDLQQTQVEILTFFSSFFCTRFIIGIFHFFSAFSTCGSLRWEEPTPTCDSFFRCRWANHRPAAAAGRKKGKKWKFS